MSIDRIENDLLRRCAIVVAFLPIAILMALWGAIGGAANGVSDIASASASAWSGRAALRGGKETGE